MVFLWQMWKALVCSGVSLIDRGHSESENDLVLVQKTHDYTMYILQCTSSAWAFGTQQ